MHPKHENRFNKFTSCKVAHKNSYAGKATKCKLQFEIQSKHFYRTWWPKITSIFELLNPSGPLSLRGRRFQIEETFFRIFFSISYFSTSNNSVAKKSFTHKQQNRTQTSYLCTQGCQIFHGKMYQNGETDPKINQIAMK
jgi:hypothetical protein